MSGVMSDANGLYYMRARYYSPENRQFINQDVLLGGLESLQSMNRYAYCGGDPIQMIDPSGYMSCSQTDNLLLGIGASVSDSVKDLLNTFKKDSLLAIGELAKAVWNNQLSVKDLAAAMGQSIIKPYGYAKNNFDDIFRADPSDREVFEYGRNVGQILQDIAGVVGGAAACKALAKACPKLVNLFKKMDNICFTGDTPVYTSEGTKPIADIEVGDEVYSEDPESGEKGLKKVTRVFVNEADVLVKVYAGSENIKTTPTHPFWVEGKGWIAAGELIQGDQVRLYSDQFLEISKVILERLPETIKVYNFEVKGWHTYFVSESNVLVHNSCAVNLPAWKKIRIDMEHILSGHTVGGSRVSNNKTLFPAKMNQSQIEKAIQEAS